jgi:hypothetical protein
MTTVLLVLGLAAMGIGWDGWGAPGAAPGLLACLLAAVLEARRKRGDGER